MVGELHRCWKSLLAFIEALVAAFAIAAVSSVVGVSLIFGSKMVGFGSLHTLGEAIIVAGVCFAAWRVIAAEFVAIATLMNWRQHG